MSASCYDCVRNLPLPPRAVKTRFVSAANSSLPPCGTTASNLNWTSEQGTDTYVRCPKP
jgi:hypothetical protein